MGVFVTDSKLSIVRWDGDIERLTQKSAALVLGKKYYDALPRIVNDNEDAISKVFRTGKPLTLRGYCIRCFLGQIHANISIRPVRASDGSISAEATVSLDSTCSVARELSRSQQLIDIGKTASALAHGVRNPLNAIKGAVVYLSEKYAEETVLIEFLDIMEEEIGRLDSFISKFLSTSLLNAERTLTDVNALLKRLEVFTSLQAQSHKVAAVYEYGDVPPIMINAFLIEQAVLNVINNSLEAMQSRGRLTVKTCQKISSGGGFLVIEISDTGPGIAGRRIESLDGPSQSGRGRGFGLFITREILQYCGGHLEIASRKGMGTAVRLSLPAETCCKR